MGPLQRLGRLGAAALAGAGGLGLEVILLGAAALSLGFSRAGALGLGAYVAGWAMDLPGVWITGTLLVMAGLVVIPGMLWTWWTVRHPEGLPVSD